MDRKTKISLIQAAFDGLTISLGAVVALSLQHLSKGALFSVISGLAASTAISTTWNRMTASELNDNVIYSGLANFGGVMLPALPLIFWHGFPAILALLVMLFVAGQLVGKSRGRDPYLVYDVYIGLLIILTAVFLIEWATGGIK